MNQNTPRPAKRTPTTRLALIAILLAAGLGTFFAWRQATDRADTEARAAFEVQTAGIIEAINDRVNAYANTLHGFRGLFHSSEQVSEKEFHDYLEALDLEQSHPGFNTINFISR